MPHFAEPFNGWLIRIGPEAFKYRDPYLHSLPISSQGEFAGLSTVPLTVRAAREGIQAARELGLKPFWRRVIRLEEKVFSADLKRIVEFRELVK